MANLTDRLPLTNGTNRVIADPAGPSALGAIADFISNTMQGAEQIRSDVTKANAKRAAEAKQAAQNDVALMTVNANDAALRAVNQSQPDPAPAEAAPESDVDPLAPLPDSPVHKDAVASGERIKTVSDAVSQKKMPPISLEAAVAAEFRKIITKHPDQVEYAIDMWKKTGLDVMLFRQVKDYADWADNKRETEQGVIEGRVKQREELIKGGREAMGELSVGMSDDQLYAQGLKRAGLAVQLDLAHKTLENRLAEASINEKSRAAIVEDTNYSIAATVSTDFYNRLAPVADRIRKLGDLVTQNPNNPEAIASFQALGTSAKSMFDRFVESSVQAAVSNGYRGDPNTIRSDLRAKFSTVNDLFSGDHAVMKVNQDALQAIKTASGLDIAQSLPLFSALKTAGLKPEEIPSVMQGVANNPRLAKQLSQEIKGFAQDFGEDRASTHLMNVVKILRGESTLADMSPQAARSKIGLLQTTTTDLAKKYVAGKVNDPDAVVHGIGELSIAARRLAPTSGANVLLIATHGVAAPSVRGALFKALRGGGDPTMTRATLQASAAASAQLVQNGQVAIGAANRDNKLFQIRWNNETGKYYMDNSAWRKAVATANKAANVNTYGGGSVPGFLYSRPVSSGLTNMKPPEEMEKLIQASNMNLDNIVEINRQVPLGPQANDIDLRRFFGANRPLPTTGKENVNIDKEIKGITDDLQEMISGALAQPTVHADLPNAIAGAENSTGNPAAKNPRSSATGDGQFISSTWLSTVKKHAPEVAQGKSDAEILQLRTDPAFSRRMITAHARDNASVLTSSGLPATKATLSLAHFAGAGGAVKILKADPTTPIENLMSAREIQANSFLRGKSASEVIQWAARRVGA